MTWDKYGILEPSYPRLLFQRLITKLFSKCINKMLDKVKYTYLHHPEKRPVYVAGDSTIQYATNYQPKSKNYQGKEPRESPKRRPCRLYTGAPYVPDRPEYNVGSETPCHPQPRKGKVDSERTNSLSHFDFPKSNCFKKMPSLNPSREPSPNGLPNEMKSMLKLNLAGCQTATPRDDEIDSPYCKRAFRTDRPTPQPYLRKQEQYPYRNLATRRYCPVTQNPKKDAQGPEDHCFGGLKQKEFSMMEGLKETASTLATVSFHKKCNQTLKHTSSVRKPHNLSRKDLVVIKQLGSGKFSKVYMVRERKTGFLAALKCISKEQIIKENLLNQIIREIKISSYISHPNLMGFYGYFDDSEYLYLLYELGCDGQLYKKLKQNHTFSEEATAFIIRQVLEAVAYLHKHKIVHRDIKPENIVLSHGNVKLCDVGWSVYASGGEMRATMCGTPLYASPEILQGRLYDEKIDLWAIGILAYELYFGNIPFDIKVEQDLVRIVTDDVVFPYESDASLEFRDFIQSILRKNPSDRLSCQQLLKHSFIQRYSEFETCDEVCSEEPY